MNNINVKDIQGILIKRHFWEIQLSNKTFIINPLKSNLILFNKDVDIKKIHERTVFIHDWGIEQWRIRHNYHFEEDFLPIYIGMNSGQSARALYKTIQTGRTFKFPTEVLMGVELLNSIDNWSFTLAHEFSHFFKYLDVKPLSLFEHSKYIMTYLVIIVTYTCLFAYLVESLFIFMDIFVPNGYLFFSIVLCMKFFLLKYKLQDCLYYLLSYHDKYKSHQEEYLCDREAKNLFPEINPYHTFLMKAEQRSHSHPSCSDRISYLNQKSNMRFYKTIPNSMKKHDDLYPILPEFKDIKLMFKDIRMFLKTFFLKYSSFRIHLVKNK